MPNTDKLDTQIARKQRELSRKQGWPKDRRPKSNRGRRDNATHQVSRTQADTVHTMVVEDLNTKAMTKSARGTVEKPGRQVKRKSGLNRSILASSWGSLDRKLAYTSQICSRCGHVHRDNRASQAGSAGSGPTPLTMRLSTFWFRRDFRGCPFRPAGQGLLHGEGSRRESRRPVNEAGTSMPCLQGRTLGSSSRTECQPLGITPKKPGFLPLGGLGQ